jgi:FSR family fosmidomycin resistance protein-like MFS transporter
VLGAISTAHMLNDMMQSLILAIYPILKGEFALSFTQIGLITLTYQLTASLLQPLVGLYTDKKPVPYSLPVGMTFTLSGLLLLAYAPNFADAAGGRRAGGHGLVDLPSGVVARRAHGLGRTARPGAVAVPGRRQHRQRARAAGGRVR